VAKAEKRTKECDRTDKNSFVVSDFLGYNPTQAFDIILFRESMYHVPYGQVLPILQKYSKYLTGSGVFIVRLYLGDTQAGKLKFRVKRKIDLIKRNFEIVEESRHQEPGMPTVLVFRPKGQVRLSSRPTAPSKCMSKSSDHSSRHLSLASHELLTIQRQLGRLIEKIPA
jgi:hypothetical protein